VSLAPESRPGNLNPHRLAEVIVIKMAGRIDPGR
jgi:hypothetical protein